MTALVFVTAWLTLQALSPVYASGDYKLAFWAFIERIGAAAGMAIIWSMTR